MLVSRPRKENGRFQNSITQSSFNKKKKKDKKVTKKITIGTQYA